ncbi:MAG: DegT/DnrJ/EryC1/StrS family aminotransferase, partial [Candidatus Ratteibacteria bacterium]|nr:DegT/DnrJ/EryC1/StrS family aminotransferase [Candidatus Ratteibacteria bacterium]
MEKKKSSDFRYDTGEAIVPWAAVGENINLNDIEEILKFLIQPVDKKRYKKQFSTLSRELKNLLKYGRYATKLTLGNRVTELEEYVCKMLNVRYACFITNATAGFEIGLKLSGLKSGDEVIAPAITFCSTISYPLLIGAKVVLADTDRRTLNIDPDDIERKITKKTKAIIPVHIGGYPCDMGRIMKIARAYNLKVVEDAAHAFGGWYKGKAIGAIGDFGSFSLHEVKNVTSLGEGGLVITDSEFGKEFPQARFAGFDISHPIEHWLYDVRLIKGYGDDMVAGNHSATEIQAVALLSQLKRIDKIISERRKNAEFLNSCFKDVDGIVIPPLDTKDIKPTHHLYLIQIEPEKLKGDIQMFKAKLTEKGITQIQHFAPLYRFSYLKQLGYNTENIKKSCPVAEDLFLHRFTHLPL